MSKEQKPLISFVIPVFRKSPEVFERCLKSLRDMSYKRIEIIVVFDGEPEDVSLPEIARKYTVPEKMLVIEHGGAPKARNAGYKLTTGDYVSFWDADCYAKPEMAKRWIQEFQETGADFVYSGYEFVGHMGSVASHPFDPYMLTCGNYIATMFPMKHEIFPGFDESLEAGQDWDLWLTLAEKGCQGSYIAGEGFLTEPPTSGSISGKGWSDENYRKTFRTVADKHGIPVRDILVASEEYSVKGSHIARLIGADFHTQMDFRRNDYKLALSIGISVINSQFVGAPSDCIGAQYWTAKDIEGLEGYGLLPAIKLLEKFKDTIHYHFVNELVSQKRLKRLFDLVGIPQPEILPLPSDVDEAETALPEKYRVLLSIDEMYLPAFKTIKQDLPYIQIDELDFKTNPTASIADYSLLVSFQRFPTVDEGIRRFLINGRNVISNVQAPYCGYMDLDVTVKDFKQELIRRIRDGRYLKFNEEGQKFYKDQVSPDAFEKRIKALLPAAPMEVIR